MADTNPGVTAPLTDRSAPGGMEAHAASLERIADIALRELAPRAADIDAGHYPLELMARFAQHDAFRFHLETGNRDFASAITAMSAIARGCGATGFLTWCHDVYGLYLDQSENRALAERRLPDHAAGRTFGGTALSNPMKALAGIEPMILRARRARGGYVVSGTLPWISHIREGQYCAAIARVEGGRDDHEIFFHLPIDDRVGLTKCPKFSGMEGTSTWGIALKDFFVPEEDLIADPARPFIARVRARFILLQMGMGLGVVRGSIDDMEAVEDQLGHVNQFLTDRPDALVDEHGDLYERTMAMAGRDDMESGTFFMDVLDLRAEVSELSLRAAQSALLHQGARGYLMASAPQRRVREAHFVAIVTPAIKHLRWQMAKLSTDIQPDEAAA
ncbi:acyl-CoA dehydrogenase family protein [Citreimonas sp.]|uniref:acyl-CoA dehydrogenase family protein n=1 Tax=Citreimonas sp. TaxID=3036715 RepID=UPI00405817D4